MIDAEFKDVEEGSEEIIGRTKSPVPPEPIPQVVEMDFYSALKKAADGEKITKLEWKNTQIFGLMDKFRLRLHKEDGSVVDWIISDGDLAGEDWITL